MKLIGLTTADGAYVASRVRMEHSFKARWRGLLDEDELSDSEGLLLSPGGSIHTFGMRFSIDVVFLNRQLRIRRLVRRVVPRRIAFAPIGTRYVLELAAGRIDAVGLKADTYICVAVARSNRVPLNAQRLASRVAATTPG